MIWYASSLLIAYLAIAILFSIFLFKRLPSLSHKNTRDCIDAFLLSAMWPGVWAMVILAYFYFKLYNVLKKNE